MKPRTLAVLVPLAAASLSAGWYLDVATEPGTQATAEHGRLLFPDLTAKLDHAVQVELVHGANALRLVKDAKTGVWGVAERGGYPADTAKLRALLTGLTELRLAERRTADPALFSRLGLEDPAGKDATSTLIRVQDSEGHPIAAVIAGHTRYRTGGNLPEQVYVRSPGQDQTWLAEGKLDLDADPLTWLDRDIMDIKPSQIASVRVSTPASQIVLVRNGDKLAMQQPADHPLLDNDRLNDVLHALDLLTLQDVRPSGQAPKGDSLGSAVFTTSDGLAVTAAPIKAGNDLWVSFTAAAAGGGDAVAKAAALNARLSGWAYQVGSWKQKALAPGLDDLKAPPPAASAPAASPSPVLKP